MGGRFGGLWRGTVTGPPCKKKYIFSVRFCHKRMIVFGTLDTVLLVCCGKLWFQRGEARIRYSVFRTEGALTLFYG